MESSQRHRILLIGLQQQLPVATASVTSRAGVAAVFMDDTCFTPTDDADLPAWPSRRLLYSTHTADGRAGGRSRCASRVGRVGARPGPDT